MHRPGLLRRQAGCACQTDGRRNPKLVQITTAYGQTRRRRLDSEPRQYVEIRQEKPKNKYQQDAPEYRTCRHLTEAIITDGTAKDVTTAGCIGFGGKASARHNIDDGLTLP
jgi:hypothetical protein